MYHTLDTQKSMKPLFGHPVSKYWLRPWTRGYSIWATETGTGRRKADQIHLQTTRASQIHLQACRASQSDSKKISITNTPASVITNQAFSPSRLKEIDIPFLFHHSFSAEQFSNHLQLEAHHTKSSCVDLSLMKWTPSILIYIPFLYLCFSIVLTSHIGSSIINKYC